MSHFLSRMRSNMSEQSSEAISQLATSQQLRAEDFPGLGHLQQNISYKLVGMPRETTLLASACWNAKFRPDTLFVPLSAAEDVPHGNGLYEIDLSVGRTACESISETVEHNLSSQARLVCVLPPNGHYYGIKLTSQGICYLCCANRSLILKVDLASENPRREATVFTFLDQASNVQPSDVTIDERHNLLYVACYQKEFDALTAEGEVLNTLRTHAQKKGLIYRIPLDTGVPELFADRLSQIAGCNICYRDDALWVSELTNLVRIPLHPSDTLPTGQWRRVAPFNPTLLAHNICVDENSGLAFCLLSFCSYIYHHILHTLHPILLLHRIRPILFGRKRKQEQEAEEAITALTSSIENGAAEAITTVDVDGKEQLQVVCFGMYDFTTGVLQNYKVDYEPWSNDHCMHVEKAGNNLAFLNYAKKEVLIVKANNLFSSAT